MNIQPVVNHDHKLIVPAESEFACTVFVSVLSYASNREIHIPFQISRQEKAPVCKSRQQTLATYRRNKNSINLHNKALGKYPRTGTESGSYQFAFMVVSVLMVHAKNEKTMHAQKQKAIMRSPEGKHTNINFGHVISLLKVE